VKADFDWARQVSDILRRLHGVLSDTIMSWKAFSSLGEDIDQFAGTSINTRLSLRAIRSIFRDLEGDEKRLDVLKSGCSAFLRAVSRISFPSATCRLESSNSCTDIHDLVGASLTVGS
jgi:hypothetical protein